MLKSMLFFVVAVSFLCISCAEDGKMGPVGPEGPPGVSLIREYTGSVPDDGSFFVDVPEIKDRRNSTFVMAYWAFDSSPEIWIPMTDGWLDSEDVGHIFSVSWTYGRVYFFFMAEGDLYLIQIFEHST
jgi:hypothetical protein